MKNLTLLTLALILATSLCAQRHFKAGEYRGGVNALYTHLSLKLKFTDEATDLKKSGVAYAAFTTDKQGNIDSAWIVQEFDPTTSKNILETIRSMAGFEPGSYHGKPVPVLYTFSIIYDNKSHPIPDLVSDESVYTETKMKFKHVSRIQPMTLTSYNALPQLGVKKQQD